MKVTLCTDIIHINGVRFLTAISRHICFGTGFHIKDATLDTLELSLNQVKDLYSKRGFEIEALHMDGQFEPIQAKAAGMGMTLNVVSRDEHVPEIERYNRTVKEHVRSAKSTLPFKRLPVRFLIELVAACIFWLNVLPAHGGISTTMSPRTIITGLEIDYNKHCRMQPGEFV